MESILSFLQSHEIEYTKFDHTAVFTVEESSKLPAMPGHDTKNLFLRDEGGERYFLVTVGHEKRVDLKALKPILGAKKLSFGSPEKLLEYLGVTPGSVTLLGALNDVNGNVKVYIDEAVWKSDAVQCHPLVNTATLVVPQEGLVKFLQLTKHEPTIIDVPARES